jgi:hypothetical protein
VSGWRRSYASPVLAPRAEACHALRTRRWVNQDFLKSGTHFIVANGYIGSVFQQNLNGILRSPANPSLQKKEASCPGKSCH